MNIDDNVSVSVYCDVMLAGDLRDCMRYAVISMPFDVWINQERYCAECCSYCRCF